MSEREESGGWARVRELVERAFELPPAEREALFAGEDEELVREARALLELDATPSPFDAAPASDAFAELLQPPAPARVGPWELRRELGAGGMGRVFLAVRADGAFHQRVALKRLRVELDDAAARERFKRERQVLANLQHPGIARLVDGGVAEDGAPYLVMEYVEGLAIDRYCDEARLTVRERLALFRQVCDAVHHAHQNLVVHRDLKPANVLVTTAGEVKLCDFGIAKILDPEKSSAEPELTAPLQRLFTPSYASPEHLRGLAITTASDVYSLGVLLYELLTGRPPHELGSRSAAEVERTICEEEPERPSAAVARPATGGEGAPTRERVPLERLAALRRTSPRALRRELAGDLDRVVLQALRKEPQRRYASAEQLGADLERYLRGLPVLARPDTSLYRTSRFLARHRGAVGAAAVALLLLLAGLATSIAQYRRADAAAVELERERDAARGRATELELLGAQLGEQKELAEARLTEVEALNVDLESARALAQGRLDELTGLALRLVFDVHGEIHGLEGATRATELVLRTGLEALDSLDEAARDDPLLLRRLSNGYLRMAEVQGDDRGANLGRGEDARRSYERALELAEAAHALAPGDPANAFALAGALQRRGAFLLQRGDVAGARADFEAAVAALEELPEETRWSSDGLVYVGLTLRSDLARLRSGDGRAAEAFEELEAARELLDRLALHGQPPAVVGRARAGLALLRAECLAAEGEVDAALDECWSAIDELEELLEPTPTSRELRHDLSAARDLTATILAEAGDLASALALREENQVELEAAAAADPEDRRALLDLVAHFDALARLHERRGDTPAELACHEERLERTERLAAAHPGDARIGHWRASARIAVGSAKLKLGRVLEAALDAKEAQRAFEELSAREPEAAWLRLGRVASLQLLAATHRAMAERSTDDDLGAAERERARDCLDAARAELDEIERRGLPVPDLAARRRELD